MQKIDKPFRMPEVRERNSKYVFGVDHTISIANDWVTQLMHKALWVMTIPQTISLTAWRSSVCGLNLECK